MKIQLIGLILFVVTTTSCKQQILLVDYGTEEKLLVYSDTNLKKGNITLKIKDYNFCFKSMDFQSVLNKNYDIEFEALSYLKDFTNQHLKRNGFSVSIIDEDVRINGTLVKFPLSFDIKFVLDKLVKKGQFYIAKEGTQLKFIEYRYWQPQYQGAISSHWIVHNKEIIELIWGFVD